MKCYDMGKKYAAPRIVLTVNNLLTGKATPLHHPLIYLQPYQTPRLLAKRYFWNARLKYQRISGLTRQWFLPDLQWSGADPGWYYQKSFSYQCGR